MRRAILLLAMSLSGCAGHRVPRGGETITFATTACHGTCPVYSVTLGPDGQGIFTGEAHTQVIGERRFRAAPDQVRSYTAALSRVRPSDERLIEPGQRTCKIAATDLSSIDVQWQGAGGASHLRLYTGCRGKKAQKLTTALRGLPLRLLPLQDFVGAD